MATGFHVSSVGADSLVDKVVLVIQNPRLAVSYESPGLGHRTLVGYVQLQRQEEPALAMHSSSLPAEHVSVKQSFWQWLIEALKRASEYAPMQPLPLSQGEISTPDLHSLNLEDEGDISHRRSFSALRENRDFYSPSSPLSGQPSGVVLPLSDLVSEPDTSTIEMAGSTGSGGGKRQAAANSISQSGSNRSNPRTSGDVLDDHGDSRDSATRLTIGDSTSGEINPGSDEDYFSVSATAGDQIVFDINAATLGSPLDSVLELYDSSGRRVAYADDDGDTLDSYMEYRVESDGEYYLKVRAFGRRGGQGYFYDLNTSQQ